MYMYVYYVLLATSCFDAHEGGGPVRGIPVAAGKREEGRGRPFFPPMTRELIHYPHAQPSYPPHTKVTKKDNRGESWLNGIVQRVSASMPACGVVNNWCSKFSHDVHRRKNSADQPQNRIAATEQRPTNQ